MKKYVVITRTMFDGSLKEQVMKLSQITMGIYRKQPGLISAEVRVSPDENCTEHILEWDDVESHKASWRNPEFFEWNLVWQELIKTGKLKMEFHTYRTSPNVKVA
ncbi:MAG TPA: hypothetical protein DDW81_14465 [Cryomorphaceae bacterium]|nr:hypothetical protein [Cryomorphaceae bacterium]